MRNVLQVEFPCECDCKDCSGVAGYDVIVVPDGSVVIKSLDDEPEEYPLAVFNPEEWERVVAFVAKLHAHANCGTCASEAEH